MPIATAMIAYMFGEGPPCARLLGLPSPGSGMPGAFDCRSIAASISLSRGTFPRRGHGPRSIDGIAGSRGAAASLERQRNEASRIAPRAGFVVDPRALNRGFRPQHHHDI